MAAGGSSSSFSSSLAAADAAAETTTATAAAVAATDLKKKESLKTLLYIYFDKSEFTAAAVRLSVAHKLVMTATFVLLRAFTLLK